MMFKQRTIWNVAYMHLANVNIESPSQKFGEKTWEPTFPVNGTI